MKTILKRIMPFILSVEILVASFFTCSVSVYAADFMPHDIVEAVEYGIEYNDWEPFWRFLNESKDGLMFLYSQMGAFVTQNFQAWVDNNKALESLAETVPTPAKKEEENIIFTKEFMTQLKALLDEYAKTEQTKEENGGFYLLPTIKASDVSTDSFYNASQYRTFNYLLNEKGVLAIYFSNRNDGFFFFDPYSDIEKNIVLVGKATHINDLKENPLRLVDCNFFDINDWKYYKFNIKNCPDIDKVYTSVSQIDDYISPSNSSTVAQKEAYINSYRKDDKPFIASGGYHLCSSTGEKIRVFGSEAAAKNYSVANRKVYFTENYYNYVPEDLTVSIDDLQKSVDDLQKVIDDLLDQIGDDTSEKEIEDLLRQILEELKNQQGGGGSGGGGGDVNVDIDLSTTNSLLSKILAKVTQIFDKISETATGAVDAANTKLQETLDEILSTLKSIRRWTIADTVLDGVDALADVASLLKDFLTAPAAAIGTAASSLGETANILTDKFPFSIPWDLAALVTLLSAEPQAPVFKLPITIESAGIEEYMEIDMSQFEALSTIMRGMLSIIYTYGILSMTTKVMDIGGKK